MRKVTVLENPEEVLSTFETEMERSRHEEGSPLPRITIEIDTWHVELYGMGDVSAEDVDGIELIEAVALRCGFNLEIV